MKKYIKSSKIIDELALGMNVLVGQTWSKLIDSIYDNTQFNVDPDYIRSPKKYIILIDPDHNEYESEVTKYSNGQYELRIDNIHATGQKIDASTNIQSSRMFEDDIYLPLEHAIDTAEVEANKLFRSERDKHNPFVSEQARYIELELEKLKKRVRNLRSFMNKDYHASENYQTMLEDNSKYLKD